MATAPRREDYTDVVSDLEARIARVERLRRSPLFLPESDIPGGRADGGQLIVNGDELIFVDETGAQTVLGAGGGGGTGSHYHHVQGSASTTWHVHHALGYKPAGVIAQDSSGNWQNDPEVVHVDDDNVDLIWGASMSGDAYLS